MTQTAGGFVAKTAISRLAGEQPSRSRALLAASAVAVGAGVTVYRLLRSADDQRDS